MWMLGLSAGALGVLLLHHVTRGAWGVMIRRILEAAASPADARLRGRGVPADRLRHPFALRVDARRGRRGRRDPHAQEALAEHDVVPDPIGDLLRHLDRLRRDPLQALGAPGRDGRPPPRPLDAALGRRRPRRLSPLHDVRGVRLAHVAHAALVLHDLRPLRDHRAGRRGHGSRGARRASPRGGALPRRPVPAAPPARLRQAPLRVRLRLGLLRLLAVHHHLVGEPARGDDLLHLAG